MALASALCVGLAVYITAPKGSAATYTATAEGFQSDVTVTMTLDGGTVTDVQLDVSGETVGIGADAGETLAANIKAANGSEFEAVSGATVTSNAVRTAVEEIMAQAGGGATYTASAQGYQSDVTVTMTFDGDTVTDVQIDVSGETEAIGGAAGEELAANVKAANGGEFDGVSGATVTSGAVKTAVEDIMAQKG